MSNVNQFPNLFFSKAPLKHNVNVITTGEGTKLEKYCVLSVQVDSNMEQNRKANYYYSDLAPYNDNESEMLDCCEIEESYEINPTKSGKYLTSFYLPSALHAVIIGPRGSKLRELQDNTRTLIKVPKPNESDLIKITGNNERSVASARTQIALLTLAKREKMAITHFVSIPMFSEEIRNNFQKFKSAILNGPPTRGIDETVFQNPAKFHLTIVTLTLLDQQEIDEAKNVLNTTVYDSVRKFFKTDQNRHIICMQGIEIMNDDPSEVNVLYGKVNLKNSNDNQKLHILADEIVDCFYRQGLVKKQYDNVKLHVTLMNSLFRKKIDDYERIEEKRESFDATYILEKYKDFYFGTTTFREIHLSIRFTTKNGYYDSEITITV